jgi:hypothetical protein
MVSLYFEMSKYWALSLREMAIINGEGEESLFSGYSK